MAASCPKHPQYLASWCHVCIADPDDWDPDEGADSYRSGGSPRTPSGGCFRVLAPGALAVGLAAAALLTLRPKGRR